MAKLIKAETEATNGVVEHEAPKPVVFTFAHPTGSFTAPMPAVITGKVYNDVMAVRRALQEQIKEQAPLAVEVHKAADKDAFVVAHYDQVVEQNERGESLNHAHVYDMFRVSLDTSRLTEAQKNFIASDNDSDFWLDQDLEAIAAWTARFRERVGK